LMITYLPIFSGNEARLFCDFGFEFWRVLLKGDRVPRSAFSVEAEGYWRDPT
jgi:hypothetical protein